MLAEEVVKGLAGRKLRITTVESCTGGAIASALTDASGASEVFQEGFITYSNEAKVDIGVPPGVLMEFGIPNSCG